MNLRLGKAIAVCVVWLLSASTSGSYAQYNYISTEKLANRPVFILKDDPDVKVLSPIDHAKTLREYELPPGYHFASSSEIEDLTEEYASKGLSLPYPLYCDIMRPQAQTQLVGYSQISINITHNMKFFGNGEKVMCEYPLYATLIDEIGKSSNINLSYYLDPNIDDFTRDRLASRTNKDDGDISNINIISNAKRMNESLPQMTPGFVYLIKDPDMEIFDKVH